MATPPTRPYPPRMSGDELLALVFSALAAVWGWSRWAPAWWRTHPRRRVVVPIVAWVGPWLCVALLYFVLARWAAHDVRDSTLYTVFYLTMGVGWTGLLLLLLPFFGLDWRDDVVERANPAAALAVTGALLGGMLAFAGGNIGDGPGWWVVVFSGGLATGALLLLWVLANAQSHVADLVTLDRDLAAGWRASGFFVGAGMVLGRAAAGDWHSALQTTLDFLKLGWPALVLCEATVVMNVLARPTPHRPRPDPWLLGAGPALLCVGLGLLVVWFAGAP